MSIAPPGFRLLFVLAICLLCCSLVSTGAYEVGAGTEHNRIHLALTDYHHIGSVDSFKSELIAHPDWLTVTDQQIIAGRVTELVIEFNVGQAAPDAAGELSLRIEALDSTGQQLAITERSVHLVLSPTPPQAQHSFRIDECCIPIADVVTEPVLPQQYILLGNHPNPFAASTDIRFGLPRPAAVTLRICDITGRCIDQFTTAELSAGYHRITWTGRDARGRYVAPGVYFYQLSTDDWSVSRKMLLLQ